MNPRDSLYGVLTGAGQTDASLKQMVGTPVPGPAGAIERALSALSYQAERLSKLSLLLDDRLNPMLRAPTANKSSTSPASHAEPGGSALYASLMDVAARLDVSLDRVENLLGRVDL